MAEEYQVTLPKLGESITYATVVQWFKQEGDEVNLDEPLLEVSTDKVNSEIPSPVAGVLKKVVARVEQELQVGEILAVIEVGAVAREKREEKQEELRPLSPTTEMQDVYSPALLRLAKEHHIAMEELAKISGTGAGGRVSKRDLEMYVQKKRQPCSMSPGVERVKMSGMRKAIADNMVRSFYEAPHASLVTEVDVTEILRVIQQEKEKGIKLTITAFVADALAKAVGEYPLLNASLEGDTIAIKKFVNLGIAVSVDQGILVPVIKNAQLLTPPQLGKAIAELALKAREGTLTPSDMQGGTITLTNFGISGVMIGIPIIRHPEVAIIGVGAIHKKVAVTDNDQFAVRQVLNLSLTFDHRVLDGMYGCAFLNSMKHHLER